METTNQTTQSAGGGARWQREVAEIRSTLRRLGDQTRVKAHLATKEVRKLWERLEAKLPELERKLEHAGEQGRKAADELVAKLWDFRRRLDGRPN